MQPFYRKPPAIFALSFLLLPFVVGFDVPDSTGTYVKVSGGRGTFHVSGCTRGYDADLLEGQAAVRSTFPIGGGEKKTFWSRLRPEKVTVGAFGNIMDEEMTLVDADSSDLDSLGLKSNDHGYAFAATVGLDWKWMGLVAGVGRLNHLQHTDAIDNVDGPMPVAAVRLGPEYLFLSGELCTASPLFSGGGAVQAGVGGRFKSTRLWGGVTGIPYKSAMLAAKAAQNLGPVTLSVAGAYGLEDIPPAGLGIDHEYAISLGLEARLPQGH